MGLKIKVNFDLKFQNYGTLIDMKSMSLNTRLVVGTIILLCAVTLVAVIRSKQHNSLAMDPNGGNVTISAEYAGSQVVVDNLVLLSTATDKEYLTFDKLTAYPHQFAVTKEGYWPWVKTLTPALHTSTSLQSFSVLINPTREDVASSSNAFLTFKKQFKSLAVPSSKTVLQSKDGNMAIWANQNQIFAEWIGDSTKVPYYFCKQGICNSRIIVVTSRYNIRSLDFLPENSEVIVFANDTSINAIELNRDDVQNFQPIYQTAMPQFILDSEHGMTVDSEDSIFRLSF